jgi:two-component system sensor histidine kinase ChiS
MTLLGGGRRADCFREIAPFRRNIPRGESTGSREIFVEAARIVRVGGSDADNRVLEAALRTLDNAEYRRASPQEAIALLTARKVDVMLLDLMQPNADVIGVLQAAAPGGGAKSRASVIVTGPANASDRVQQCLQHGAEDFVNTPFDGRNALLVSRRVALCIQRRTLSDATVRLKTLGSRPEDTATIEMYTNASGRFVPREFLEHLGRKTLADVRLGDHVAREMTVLFCDIRDFTTLSERMTPSENFNFLNSYLRQVTPIIRSNRGFVDKYIGDGIMALFPESPSDAVDAAIALQKQVVVYNHGRRMAGYDDIRIGIGLHSGELILGTIGEDERMQTTVISDAVNVASRIEGLTKTFGVSLLVSGSVVAGLQERHVRTMRHLGAVKAKGKTRSVEIFECFENDPEQLMEHKRRTLEPFVAAMAEFRKGMFLTAGRIFGEIANLNRDDAAAAYFRQSCTLTMVRERGSTPWDGAEVVEVK